MRLLNSSRFARLTSYRIVTTLAISLLATALFADKTDIVVLRNGDRITCEIKKLEKGRLRVSTDTMGTVDIEWHEIASITSIQRFEIEMSSGAKYFGSMVPTDEPGRVEVTLEDEVVDLPSEELVIATPIESDFWSRLDGRIDLGFDFTSATDTTKWNLGAQFDYRTTNYSYSLDASSIFTGQQDAESASRNNVKMITNRFLRQRWFTALVAQLEQNEQLNLELRSFFAAGFGRRLVQTNRRLAQTFGGVGYSRERFQGGDGGTNEAEAIFGFQYSAFTFDDHESEVDTSFFLFPSLSQAGRYRAELNGRFSVEVFDDFVWSVSMFNSFDSEPQGLDTERNDFGVFTSFGWVF